MLSLRKFALVPAFALMAALIAAPASAGSKDHGKPDHGAATEKASEIVLFPENVYSGGG